MSAKLSAFSKETPQSILALGHQTKIFPVDVAEICYKANVRLLPFDFNNLARYKNWKSGFLIKPIDAPIAQLAERRPRNAEVGRSNRPGSPTSTFRYERSSTMPTKESRVMDVLDAVLDVLAIVLYAACIITSVRKIRNRLNGTLPEAE